jgi:hypothetical protein
MKDSNAEPPSFYGDQGFIAGKIVVDELGGISVIVGDAHYSFDLEAPTARKLAEAILANQRPDEDSE